MVSLLAWRVVLPISSVAQAQAPLLVCVCVCLVCPQNVLSERLSMAGENWRLCYKALLLLEFLVKQGPLVCARLYVCVCLRVSFSF
jgi:hypothetical protein